VIPLDCTSRGIGSLEELGDGACRALMRVVPDGVLIVDDHSLIVEANARAEEMFGFERHGLTAVPLRSVLPQGLINNVVAYPASTTGERSVRNEALHLTARGVRLDGSNVPVTIRHRPIPLSRGTGTLLLLIATGRAEADDGHHECHGAATAEPFLVDLLPIINTLSLNSTLLTGALARLDEEHAVAATIRQTAVDLDRIVECLRTLAVSRGGG
jgi:PAS domain S-box-containing protein